MSKHTYTSKKWHILVNKIASSVIFNRFRSKIYKNAGIKEIDDCDIRDNVFFYSNKVKIGKGSFVNRCCYFNNYDFVEIGERCFIAPEVMFCTTNHEIGTEDQRAGRLTSAPIKVEDGTWIGTKAIILPGVTIGRGCIIAAGTVVTKDCEANGMYAGIPARRIKELSNSDKVKQIV
jgi:maltose O-acetyltransferase